MRAVWVGINEAGEMYFTCTSEAAKRRFLRDYYNLTTAEDLDKNGKNPSGITADEAFEKTLKATKWIPL